MRPERRRALNRALLRHRLWGFAKALLIGVPVLTLLSIVFWPTVDVEPHLAKLTGFQDRSMPEDVRQYMLFETPDGQTLRIRAGPGDAATPPGTVFCIGVGRQFITGLRRTMRLPRESCGGA